jgi:gluconolactonase
MREFTVVQPRFEHYVLDNAGWRSLPAAFAGSRTRPGCVTRTASCSDLPRNRTMRRSEATGVSIDREPSNYANGQTRDRQGRLVACSHRGRCLYRTEYDGTITTLATHHDGRRLNSPNDVVVKSDGTIWFSDPVYGISNDYEGGRQASEQPPALYRFDPATGDIRVVAGDFDGPNGLAFSPDERRLYVAETGDQSQPEPRQYIRVFDVATDSATLTNRGGFHKIEPGYADGFRG